MSSHITPPFDYPWDGLESYLSKSGQEELWLLGYGRLMNQVSASLTLRTTDKDVAKPVVAYGLKRIFNYKMPEVSYERHGDPKSSRHIAALNVLATGDSKDEVNGVMVRVAFDDLDALRTREVGYDLIAVAGYDWQTKEPLEHGIFALSCPEVYQEILPHVGYLGICRSGAKAISAAFHDFFIQSTCLANGESLAEWGDLND